MVELVVSIHVLTIKFFQLRCGFENLQTYQGWEGWKGRTPHLNKHTLAQPSESPGLEYNVPAWLCDPGRRGG